MFQNSEGIVLYLMEKYKRKISRRKALHKSLDRALRL
jgi:hypothetical protein